MAYDALENKVELAFKTLVAADAAIAALGLNGYTGHDDATRALPAYVCQCLGGEEMPPFSGNYRLDVEVGVQTKLVATDPANPTEDRLAAHKANVAAVRASLAWDDLASQLSATATDFYVYPAVQMSQLGQTLTTGDSAVSTAHYRFLCAGVDL